MLSEVSHELSNQAHLRSERVFQRDTEHGASCCCFSSAPSTRSCTVLQYIILQPTGQYHHSGIIPTNQICGLTKLFLLFWPLSAVFGTGLPSVCNTCCIQCTSYDMISGTRKILYSSSTDQYNTMLLKVVAFSWNVACNFDAIGKTNSGNLSEC